MNDQSTDQSKELSVSPDILNHPERMLRLPDVKAMTGYSTASIYAKMAEGTFPVALKIGSRAIAWRLGTILDFLKSRPLSKEG
ncbi:helix-turn-helix transcriptional regulator [Desulfopila inferna]|uniref:helix-turn-helix transcriptional regulator n=1 Tax=Desulfopila inferna TaxID=468528 RepID=UPI001963E3AA|nr:AlpA family phage regulatory protein [Desulfopila inferna]MBM9604105.1 AlpA family phage regulatory protein [Desulfopila inferna]